MPSGYYKNGIPVRLGKKHKEETKRKIGEKSKGRKHPPRSEEYREKISKAQKGRKHYPWQGFQKENKLYLNRTQESFIEAGKKISKSLKGKKLSEEHKQKIGISGLGRHWKLSKEAKENHSKANKGKRRSQEYLKKIRGKNSPNWKGGPLSKNAVIKQRVEYRLWREAVFTRDNWTCQKCKERGGILHPHHIFNFADYPKLRLVVDNGITLCRKCHMKFHKRYGIKNNTRKQLEEFLKNKL